MKLPLIISFFFLLLSSFLFAQDQRPKNIIILIGDGMGVNTVSASVLSGNSPFTKFTTTGYSITTALDNLITDSAAGATAISTGVKTNNGLISLSPSGTKLKTIFEFAEEKGLSTGLVVTCSVTHATPAAFYAHNISRANEVEIGEELLETDTDVIIGAGQKFFNHKEWEQTRNKLSGSGYNVYTDVQSLLKDNAQRKIFAIIDNESLVPAVKRKFSLSDLVGKALDVLKQDKEGFVLMVEGSQIDWGAHENDQGYMLSELKDFTGAMDKILDFAAKDKQTLVLVTADHETGGVSVTDGDIDGKNLEVTFSTFYHTPSMVGIFAKGPGEKLFSGIMQNNEIGQKLLSLLPK